MEKEFQKGLRDGVPIALGYLSVGFTFGMMAVSAGLPVWAAAAVSMTNLTSAGQFAGLAVITGGAPLYEMALTQLVINLRYSLMSLSLSQKLPKGMGLLDRMAMAFCVTDEIFAVASNQPGELGRRYYWGLALLPYGGWAGGTLLGAVAGGLLPDGVTSALGIAIYAMFLAIIVPPMKHSRPVLLAVGIAMGLSCLFRYVPALSRVSAGFVIILCAMAAAAVCALLFPVREPAGQEADET